MGENRTDQVDWRGAQVPVSQRFDDPYYSLENGWAEAEHVFVRGNALEHRLASGFHIAELGFGTGLHLALLMSLWSGPGRVRYTSFEAFPMSPDDAETALSAFPQSADSLEPIIRLLAQPRAGLQTDAFEVELILGDARETLPDWSGRADAWFLDGFSPAKNPELWSVDLMAEVARHTAQGGTFATYTAAGHVRRALSDAGFEVCRVPGFGRKRHMSRGVLR